MSVDNIYLQGSEDVQRAGHAIVTAAQEMQRAASTIYESVRRLEQALEMDRYERERIRNEHG